MIPSSTSSCAAVFAHPQRPARAVFEVARSGSAAFAVLEAIRQIGPQPAAGQVRQRGSDETDRGQQVRLDRVPQGVVVDLDRLGLRRPAGVRDQDVQGAEALDGLVHEPRRDVRVR